MNTKVVNSPTKLHSEVFVGGRCSLDEKVEHVRAKNLGKVRSYVREKLVNGKGTSSSCVNN